MYNEPKSVAVFFKGNPYKHYHYLVPEGMCVENGDKAIVNSPVNGLELVSVTEVFYGKSLGSKFILGVVSRKQIDEDERRAKEYQIRHEIKKTEEKLSALKNKLNETLLEGVF